MNSPTDLLVGRADELAYLRQRIVTELAKVLIVYGPSGIGKTKLVEAFYHSRPIENRFERFIFHTVYRTDWTTALSQLKKHLGEVPANATLRELEDAIIRLASSTNLLLVLDNVEDANVADIERFVGRWVAATHTSTLVLTAQDDIRAILPMSWPDLQVGGLKNERDILTILGDLALALPVQELIQVGEALDGNPQLLLFLRWLEPTSLAGLHESGAKLADRQTADAVEDLVDQTSLSTLFFLALGVHKDLNITDELLATLWDHFGSRGAEPFVRAIAVLTERGFLTPTKPGSYRLHESVHVSLPKALRHRVGDDRIPSLHHYFAEHYRRMLHRTATSTALTHFVYHARLAQDYRLIYDTLIGRQIAQTLADAGTSLLVRSELESLHEGLADGVLSSAELVHFYLVLGRLCNDLSDHERALEYMTACEERITDIDTHDSLASLQREVSYVSAVAFSNTGQSDSCLQHYFKIVDSCSCDADELACLSLGYLAHDLKYRDIKTAEQLGFRSIAWARSFDSGVTLAKNLCSYAETAALLHHHDEARSVFREAETIAKSFNNKRELGRILTNWGFAETLAGDSRGMDMIRQGTEHSRVLGDRRRHFQGVLYGGVCLARSGDRVRGRAAICQAAQGFQLLNDGRYFVPALRWLLQLDGYAGGEDPAPGSAVDLRPDAVNLLDHSKDHPEFDVYRGFWRHYLSDLLGAKH